MVRELTLYNLNTGDKNGQDKKNNRKSRREA